MSTMEGYEYSEINVETANQIQKLFSEAQLFMEIAGGSSRAKEKYSEILSLDPNNDNALAGIADCYLLEHKYDKAIKIAKQSLEINPNNAYTLYILGNAYVNQLPRKKKHLKVAKNYYQRSLEVDPQNGDILSNIAFIELEQNNNDKAYKTAIEALEINPINEMAHMVLGWYYLKKCHNDYNKNDLEKVHFHFLQALELKPDKDYIKFNYGNVFLELAESKEGYQFLKDAIKKNPTNTIFQQGFREAYIRNHKNFQPLNTFFKKYLFAEKTPDILGKSTHNFLTVLIIVIALISIIIEPGNISSMIDSSIVLTIFLAIFLIIWLYQKIISFIVGRQYDKAFKEGTLKDLI